MTILFLVYSINLFTPAHRRYANLYGCFIAKLNVMPLYPRNTYYMYPEKGVLYVMWQFIICDAIKRVNMEN